MANRKFVELETVDRDDAAEFVAVDSIVRVTQFSVRVGNEIHTRSAVELVNGRRFETCMSFEEIQILCGFDLSTNSSLPDDIKGSVVYAVDVCEIAEAQRLAFQLGKLPLIGHSAAQPPEE